MAQGIVSAVVKKLIDLLDEEVCFLHRVGRKLDEVKVQLGQMQRFLIDADSKKMRGDERIKGWVCDVRNVAYETEDAIDNYLVEVNYQRHRLISNRVLARRTLGEKISKIQAKLSLITQSRSTFGIKDLGEDSGHSESFLQKQPSFKRHVHPDADVVGFEAEKSDVINLLLESPSDQGWFVVSIVGPGGLGKTTLAQKVFTSSDVKNHFDSCIWITVSQDFHLLDVLKKIHWKLANETELKRVLDALKEIHQKDQIDFLFGEVNTLLEKKKYLIVLDDVWTEAVFTQLETGLIDLGNGSRVLMTTRKLNVANYANSSGVYHLKFLSEAESIDLFLKKALRSSGPSPECPEELKDLAIKLVKRCNGLPLALIVLGGLVSSKPRMPREWSRVLERLDWHVIGQGECMKVLATSYDDLSYLHKSCFRYLACFPEDYVIRGKRLMKMWIAEGLIEVKKEGQLDLEDYAEDYLEELVQRCLVQVVERSPNGSIKSIRVHDLLREVALGEARENDFLLIWKEENAEKDVSMTRRVAFHGGTDESSSILPPKDFTKIKMSKLRTFVNFEYQVFKGIGFMLLGVLELRCATISDLPTDLKKMIHLRYFCLRYTKVHVIPSWIGDMQNLQTFDIKSTGVKQLPPSFWNITNLRHVLTSANLEGPPSTANLFNLRSLGNLVVPKSWKKSIPHLFSVRKLKLKFEDVNDGMLIHDLISKLNNLHSASFTNFYLPRGMIDFSTSPSYEKIHTMNLIGMYGDIIFTIAEMPRNLTKLTLECIDLNGDPMPKLEKLRSLKYLRLSDISIKADTIVCTDGGFPGLQILKLYWVWEIKEWKVENGACPVLKYLLINYCNDLSALPDLQGVNTLQELVISDPELHSKIKNMSGEEWHKVKHIPTITLNQPVHQNPKV